jgi:hypothetical protein
MALVMRAGLLKDYRYLFYINKYIKPHEWYWPALSFWWSLHGVMWADRILLPVAGILVVAVALAWRTKWSHGLRRDPAFGACFLAAAGYILFMTYQNHPQPRYYTVVALFSFLLLAIGVEGLVRAARDSAGAKQLVVEGRRLDESPEEDTSGAKARTDSTSLMPGINPRPTARGDSSAGISGEIGGAGSSGAKALVDSAGFMRGLKPPPPSDSSAAWLRLSRAWGALPGLALLVAAVVAAVLNAVWTVEYAAHPQYTFVDAARQLTRYIDQHPNGNRLLVSISGDEITMMTHLPTLCDDFGTQDLVTKLSTYEPGWWATWNDIDPGTLEDLHIHHSLEQVASFHAMDDPERNVLVLFKLHPLPGGEAREVEGTNLQVPLPGDRIGIPVQ